MDLDIRLILTAVGMLLSVVSAAVIVKQKLANVIEQLNEMKSDYETRLRSGDIRVDKLENSVSVNNQKTGVLSQMLSPDNERMRHSQFAELKTRTDMLAIEVQHLRDMHNSKHPTIGD